MKFLLSICLLLGIVHLSYQAPTTEKPCDKYSMNSTLYIDQLTFGSYSTARFHRGQYNILSNTLYLTLTAYNTVLDNLNANNKSGYYQVKCDYPAISSYPDFVFSINGAQVRATPWQYIDVSSIYHSMCSVNIEYTEYKALMSDFWLPDYLGDQICRAQRGH
ncbi:hypothetical protein M3Y94_01012500 [Aphelenchoides besseyi]|nr:hypothetical protein M3Y94_01012500 [Aphelenchoides besseyi]KAI6220502.1 hypothetical protein M3Y95_01046900 [Aphelenchoides besseyi]